MVDLRSVHLELESELLAAFARVFETGRFVLGPGVEAFESELAKLCDARHAVSCNSGTDALWLTLRALEVGPGDRVLCPAYSFFATAATIVRLGARPVFADIDPATFNLDPEDALRRISETPNLRAVVTADLFGRVCELGALESDCRARGIPIVEDAAQAIGAIDETGGKPGGRTRAACFSFYPTKNLGALGDGGSVVTSDPELARRVTRLRGHGEGPAGLYPQIGINSRLDELQAVALSIKLRHLETWTRARRQLALHYDALFAERGAAPASEPEGSGTLPLQTPTPTRFPGRHAYHRYVVRIESSKRASLIAALQEARIACEVYYERGLHQQPSLLDFAPATSSGPLRETERASREALALPLYPEMGLDRVERVVEVVTRQLSS
jgi:dTDP-4-amino-4,6-dideoxygalactose transaminase